MKYLCLANYKPADFAAMAPADNKALVQPVPPQGQGTQGHRPLRLSASLRRAQLAACSRAAARPKVTDGPLPR